MSLLLAMLLTLPAWAQEAPASAEAAPPAATQVPAEAGDTGAPASEAPDAGAADDAPPPEPWVAVPAEQREVDALPMLGPWPDAWSPPRSGQEGLPAIDPLLGDVLDPGTPFAAGPELGPTPPVEMLGPVIETEPVEVEPPPKALQPDAQVPAALVDSPAAPAQPQASPPAEPAPPAAAEPTAELVRHSLAEDFLPPPPRSGSRRVIGFLVLSLLAFLGSTVTERLGDRVGGTGLIPRLLSMLTGIGRGLTIPLTLLALLSLLPRSWSLAVPFALVALAIAMGWTSRDLLGDVFAGIVLTVERRIRPGERLERSDHRGVVNSLGIRSTRLTVDDGRMVSIPNRKLMREELRIDPDGYAPVLVPVPVHPHLSVGEVRQILQELALLSPYIAPSRPPNVYRDADRRDVWIVEARLVHPRYANAFRGALVELADVQFAEALEE